MGAGVLLLSDDLLQYLPPVTDASQGAGKYHGAVSEGYDAKRTDKPKWLLEQAIIEAMLADLPADTAVLDVPVGTGRFLPFYAQHGFHITGIDISADQLYQAAKKVQRTDAKGGLYVGNILATDLASKAVDVAVCCRITRWLSPQQCGDMMREMQRVAKSRIIWTARIANHAHARTVELFESALDGWQITHNVVGIDMDYRILQARPVDRVAADEVLFGGDAEPAMEAVA